jgi:ABC-type Fe3+-siderophore transport system permease subunit
VGNCGFYNAFMATPAIDLASVDAASLVFTFDSSWRPEAFDDGDGTNNQTAKVRAIYTVGGVAQAPVTVMHWDSNSEGPLFHPDNTNETVLLDATALQIPAGATSVTWPALAGSLALAAIVLLFCRRRVAADLPSLLLVGVALGALAQAFTTAIILRFDPGALRSILFWLMGSFAGRGWTEVWMLLPAALVGGLAIWLLHRPLDLLALGGESAHHLGVRVSLLQTAGIALAAMLAALTVAACGTIGFVGLMAPHLTRKLVGAPHGISVPGSMLVGATLTVGADLAARTLLAGTELPVGVVTGALGCLFFLALVAGKSER